MGKIVKMLVVVLVGVIFVSGTAYSGIFGKKHKKLNDKKFIKIMAKDLDLNEEQKEKILEHRKSCRKKKESLMEEMYDRKEEFRNELKQISPDHGKLNQIISEIKDLYGRNMEKKIEKIDFMKDILTDKQYEKFIENFDKYYPGYGYGKKSKVKIGGSLGFSGGRHH